MSGWNVEKCKNMVLMFRGAEKFNKDSLKNWDLSVKNTENMFNGDEGGDETTKIYVEELRKWKAERKFGNRNLMVAVKEWFEDSNTAEAKYGHISVWNTSEATDTETIKEYNELKQLDNWVKGGKFGSHNLMAAAKEWCEDSGKTEAKYGHMSGWDTSEVTSM
ncbi:hypothetical protein TL16_g00349 [Triparma laevis f. inornata]|uniref:Uncharacterized protein n=1 Tax=Triparma laevis f. inornata TaxID=1714386 RepID=A0A9W6Z5V4_9STRA|nr:hypothetical protein TL16_g00349 [Triparma laevis f. inornata]